MALGDALGLSPDTIYRPFESQENRFLAKRLFVRLPIRPFFWPPFFSQRTVTCF